MGRWVGGCVRWQGGILWFWGGLRAREGRMTILSSHVYVMWGSHIWIHNQRVHTNSQTQGRKCGRWAVEVMPDGERCVLWLFK